MKYFFILLFNIFLINACSTSDSKQTMREPSPQIEKPINANDHINSEDSNTEVAPWANDLISDYLANNKDRLKEVDGYPVAYMKDTVTRDGRQYVEVKIGHNFEHRFATNQWLFIDNETKEVYEYDLPNDALIPWTKENK